jgi:hypothetical protein
MKLKLGISVNNRQKGQSGQKNEVAVNISLQKSENLAHYEQTGEFTCWNKC